MLRRTELRPAPPPDRRSEPGYREWHEGTWGECAVCGARGRLIRHHVLAEQHLRALGQPCWNLANALLLGVHCRCHSSHHSAAARIPASCIAPHTIEYMIEVLGADVADRYIDRYYSPA